MPFEAVLFTGIPGVGKTTFYLQWFFDTHLRINLDMLKTRHREMLLVQACLAAKQSFAVDNTNVTPQERAVYIALAKQSGFHVIGYYFPSTLEAAARRNEERSGRAFVPEKGIRGRLSQLEPPAFSEGYDRLFTVRIDPKTSQFLVKELKNG